MNKYWLVTIVLSACLVLPINSFALASSPLDKTAHHPIHIKKQSSSGIVGYTPNLIKSAYNLPSTGGSGSIIIVDAYDDPTIETDLGVFDKQFGLVSCTTSNGCFEKHKMASSVSANTGWSQEIALDVEWAHAIAPKSKIVLVEAKTASLSHLLDSVDYASGRSDASAISMSWGSSEFSGESSYDSHFSSVSGATYFASSGDSGKGVLWPAVSKNAIGVGGTTLNLTSSGSVISETAWSGSGGGLSKFESEPTYQTSYGVPSANNHRAVPDVSLNADPNTGYAVYTTTAPSGQKGWEVVGGTSAAAPQLAAIHSIYAGVNLTNIYRQASNSYSSYFRDILSGSNGSCKTFCTAGKKYDYVTGLGSLIKYNH